MNDLEKGYRTSEFWVTLTGQLLAALTLIGVLSSADAASLGDALGRGIVGVFAVLSSGAVAWKYIHGRTTLKMQALPGPNAVPPPAA